MIDTVTSATDVTREEALAFSRLLTDEYFAHPALSQSELRKLKDGPSRYSRNLQGKEKKHQFIGSLFDALVTDDLGFYKRYERRPENLVGPSSSAQAKSFANSLVENWSILESLHLDDEDNEIPETVYKYLIDAYRNAYKADKLKDQTVLQKASDLYLELKAWIKFEAELDGKIPYSYAEHQEMMGMYQAVQRHPRAGKLFKDVPGMGPDWKVIKQAKSLFNYKYIDSSGNPASVRMRAMMDLVAFNSKLKQIIVNDLKSTAFPICNFLESVNKFDYDMQAWIYRHAALALAELLFPNTLFNEWKVMSTLTPVLKDDFPECGFYNVPKTLLERGRQKADGLLHRLDFHLKANDFTRSAESIKTGGFDMFPEEAISALGPVTLAPCFTNA